MNDHDSRFPEDLLEIAGRLTAARVEPSALELDEMRRRVHGRAARSRRAPRRGFAAALRTNSVAAALTLGLVLSSGVGVVFACESLGVHKSPVVTISSKGRDQGGPGNHGNQGNGDQGGNQGNQGGNQGNQGGSPGSNQGDPGGFGGVFQGTGFHGRGSASFCEYHGPQTYTYHFQTSHGTVTVILTWDCFHLHLHFGFSGDPGRGFRWGGFNYRWGGGPSYNCNQSSYDTTAPDGTNDLSFTTDGSTFNVPIAW